MLLDTRIYDYFDQGSVSAMVHGMLNLSSLPLPKWKIYIAGVMEIVIHH
jgi:hypothetical protein